MPLSNIRFINCSTATGYAISDSNEMYSWGYKIARGDGTNSFTSKYAVKLSDLNNGAVPNTLSSFMDDDNYSDSKAEKHRITLPTN